MKRKQRLVYLPQKHVDTVLKAPHDMGHTPG